MNTPVKVAQMTPAEDKRGVRVEVDVLYLDDIPKAMDNMGWTVSAQLMRRWFATKPSWEMPEDWRVKPPLTYLDLPASQVDEKLVKMAWAMKFPQVSSAMAKLKQTWNSPAGVELLGRRLQHKGWKPGQSINLGSKNMSTQQLDTESQVNRVKLGDTEEVLNDFFGAIFKAALKVAVIGKAYSKGGKSWCDIEYLGFYIRDTYDFNAGWLEDAFMGLGVWSKKRVLSKAEMIDFRAMSGHPIGLAARALKYPGFVQLSNYDFRAWQKTRNEGGDFFVFSDVFWDNYNGPSIELV